MNYESAFWRLVETYGVAKGISADQLSGKVGVPADQFGSRDVTLETLYQFADALEIEAASLLSENPAVIFRELKRHSTKVLSCDLNVLLTGSAAGKVISLSDLKKAGYTLILLD